VSQPTVPVCYRHPSRETYLRCSRCDRPICPDCMNDAAVGHQCPECAGEGRRTQRTARTAFGGTMSGQHGHVTKTLIGINVAVFVLTLIVGGVTAVRGGSTLLHVWGAMVVGEPGVTFRYADAPGLAQGVVNGEYHRIITSMFLHYGIFHLLLNMWALWVVGGVLEPLLGRARFLALYLISGVGGSIAVYLTAGMGVLLLGNPLFGEVATRTAGASGAVFGLFGAFYVILRRMGRDTSMITMILVINLIFTFAVPAISVAGHLGGLITGALVAAGLAYAPRQRRTVVQVSVLTGIVVLLVVLTLIRTAMLL
jgi:membrane associated rhomboid family serine protease